MQQQGHEVLGGMPQGQVSFPAVTSAAVKIAGMRQMFRGEPQEVQPTPGLSFGLCHSKRLPEEDAAAEAVLAHLQVGH